MKPLITNAYLQSEITNLTGQKTSQQLNCWQIPYTCAQALRDQLKVARSSVDDTDLVLAVGPHFMVFLRRRYCSYGTVNYPRSFGAQ
jgi:hypothetical protein